MRSDYPRLKETGVQIVGISCDSVHSQRVFAATLGRLPFPLASDWHRRVARDYEVLNEEWGTARRSLFVIDKDGIVRFANTNYNVVDKAQYEEMVAALERMTGNRES